MMSLGLPASGVNERRGGTSGITHTYGWSGRGDVAGVLRIPIALAALEQKKWRGHTPTHSDRDSSGAVTGTLSRAAKVGSLSSGSGCGCSRPGLERFAAEGAERGAGCEMALKIESVVDGGASEEEAVG